MGIGSNFLQSSVLRRSIFFKDLDAVLNVSLRDLMPILTIVLAAS